MIDTNGIQARTLEELHRRATRYEVIAELSGDTRIRLGFTSRITRASLIGLAREHADALLPHVGEDDSADYSGGVLSLGAVTVRKSGRTERECSIADREV